MQAGAVPALLLLFKLQRSDAVALTKKAEAFKLLLSFIKELIAPCYAVCCHGCEG